MNKSEYGHLLKKNKKERKISDTWLMLCKCSYSCLKIFLQNIWFFLTKMHIPLKQVQLKSLWWQGIVSHERSKFWNNGRSWGLAGFLRGINCQNIYSIHFVDRGVHVHFIDRCHFWSGTMYHFSIDLEWKCETLVTIFTLGFVLEKEGGFRTQNATRKEGGWPPSPSPINWWLFA